MTSTQTTEITFTKLRNGSWGIRGPQSMIAAGRRVEVTKRNGEHSFVTVDRVLWSGDGIALASIESRGQSHRHIPRYERCRNCGGDGTLEAELGTCPVCWVDYDM